MLRTCCGFATENSPTCYGESDVMDFGLNPAGNIRFWFISSRNNYNYNYNEGI